MSKSKFIFNNLGVIVGVLSMLSLVAYADVWQAPTANPPGNNVSAPINVGGSDQVKLGGLGVGPVAVFGDILVSNVYKQGGGADIKTGISLNCPGQTIGDITLSGGIITGGACASGGGGSSPVEYSVAVLVPDAYPGGLNSVGTARYVATCPAGKKVVSGGCELRLGVGVESCRLASSFPKDNGWTCEWRHKDSNNTCGGSGIEAVHVFCQ